jgi:putative oxidoreductase
MKPLVDTNTRALSIAILLLRIMAGLILFVGGAGKVLGWFGGFGMSAMVEMFKTNLHLSAFWTYLSSYTEFIGGFLIIVGLLTRFAAFALVINMLSATLFTGFAKFFMGGAAYPCLLFVIFLVIFLSGPMAYSIDALLAKRKKTERLDLKFNAAF